MRALGFEPKKEEIQKMISATRYLGGDSRSPLVHVLLNIEKGRGFFGYTEFVDNDLI